MNECDFCGDEFDYEPNPELQEQDLCVCNNCEDIAKEQLTLSREIEDSDFDIDCYDIGDFGPGINY